MSTPALPSDGDVFADRYRVLGRLGRGGHGAVYRATDLHSGNDVALKLLLPEQLDGVGKDRFRREAELGERLRNPHCVRPLAHGEVPGGLPFIAFELLEGRSLAQVLSEDGALPPGTVAKVAQDVLEALVEAHDLGMVHRDIKPANIQLCDYAGNPDFVKVLDFGIAKRSAVDATQLTAADVVVGTARYMSPEQFRGEQVHPTTDLYSLGLVMAEMLTGAPVYRGSTIEVAMEQVSPAPVPLPDEVFRSPLGVVIERATRKSPAARYASAREMLSALPASGPRTLIVGTPEPVSNPAHPVPISSPVHAVPISNPVHSAPISSPAYSMPVAGPAFSSSSSGPYPSLPPSGPTSLPAKRTSSTAWLVGWTLAALLLVALIAASTWLVLGGRSASDEPPPMPAPR